MAAPPSSNNDGQTDNPFKPAFAELGLIDPGPVPLPPSPETGESFVVIKSAEELADSDDSCSFTDMSMVHEHKKLLQEELADCERLMTRKIQTEQGVGSSDEHRSARASDSVISFNTANENNTHVAEDVEARGAGARSYDMCTSTLPAMPKPSLEPDDNEPKAVSILSFSPGDFDSAEILQAKIAQLIDENAYLKETLIQNNQSLKSHYERIVQWQRDVEKVHEAHKDKFREAKQCIETLKEENNALKLQIDASQDAKEAAKKIAELREDLEALTVEKEERLAEEAEQTKRMQEKLERYERELENAYKKIRGYESAKHAGGKSQGDSEQLKTTREERCNTEIVSLRNQLAKSVQVTDPLELALERVGAELEARNGSLLFAQNRIKSLEEQLEVALDTAKRLEENWKFSKEKEEQASIAAWQATQKLAELERGIVKSQQEAATSQTSRSQYNPERNGSELACIRQQLMQSQKALTDSEQNRAVADATVAKLINKVAELEKLSVGDEEFVLRAQLDIYKSDFEAEREAKQNVKQEMNKMAEDLQHLHRRNGQMQQEIELLREQVRQYGGRVRPASREESETVNSSRIYHCPKCNFGFDTPNAIENHVIRCIELDEVLP